MQPGIIPVNQRKRHRWGRGFPISMALLVTALTFVVSCSREISQADAMKLMDEIKQDMTFEDVQSIVPLSEKQRSSVVRHGGVFFVVPVSSNFLIELRFSHPVDQQDIKTTKICFSPRLRDRKTNVLVAGDEEPW